MILVTGATGTVGSAVLSALGPSAQALAATRRQPAGPGQRWFDFERPDSYAVALKDVHALFLMLPPGMARARARFRSLLTAAQSEGVRHVAFLSIRNADRLAILPHRGLERVIEDSGIGWTHLRPNDFMQNFATQPVYRDGIRSGLLHAAGGRSRTSYIDARDVGAVAARVLTEPGHAGRAYPLTGPEALSLSEVAAILSQALGRTVRYADDGVIGFFRHARQQGAPAPLAAVMTGIGLVGRTGLANGLDPDTARILGRPPVSFRRFAADHVDAWRSAADAGD